MHWIEESNVLIGPGALSRVGEFVAQRDASRAFVVTDEALAATAIAPTLLDALAGFAQVSVFTGVRPNPTVELIDSAGRQAHEFAADVVIALGGGSSMDAAKGIALVAANPSMSARDFDFTAEAPSEAVPILAIPTTAGTGSETNSWGVIDDPIAAVKLYIGDASTVPYGTVLDPLVTVGLPARASAATGFDALTHGIESLTSNSATDAGREFSTEAITTVSRHLPGVVRNGEDIQARSGMLIGAHIAGRALTTSGLGLAHGIAHSVSAHTGAAHGEALAAVLPEVIDFNMPVSEEEYQVAVRCMSDAGWVVHGDLPTTVEDLATSIGARRTLGELGVLASMVESIAVGAATDRVTSNNPRPVTSADVEAIISSRL